MKSPIKTLNQDMNFKILFSTLDFMSQEKSASPLEFGKITYRIKKNSPKLYILNNKIKSI